MVKLKGKWIKKNRCHSTAKSKLKWDIKFIIFWYVVELNQFKWLLVLHFARIYFVSTFAWHCCTYLSVLLLFDDNESIIFVLAFGLNGTDFFFLFSRKWKSFSHFYFSLRICDHFRWFCINFHATFSSALWKCLPTWRLCDWLHTRRHHWNCGKKRTTRITTWHLPFSFYPPFII